MKIAIQGIAGSFHDIAARRYFAQLHPSAELELVECTTFRELFEAVENGGAEYGMAAIENTIVGSIPGNYSLLERHCLNIVGEVYVRIQHCILALPDQQLEDISTVLGHPVAIGQCGKFLESHQWMRVEEFSDTASAARVIALERRLGTAAIAGYAAADLYGLAVLQECVEDQAHNTTRFLALSREPIADVCEQNKASLSIRISDRPGALAEVLSAIKYANINLSKIESVALVDLPFEYAIHLDLSWEDARDWANTLAELRRRALEVRVLGVYAEGEKDLESTSQQTYAQAITERPSAELELKTSQPLGSDWRSWGLPPSQMQSERLLIAGPCSAESEEQLVGAARQLKETGWPVALRAGIWKPRTRAGGFEGHGEPALRWLLEAKRETGLSTAVEVASAAHVDLCLRHAVDILWVGARTTGNPFSVQEIADSLAGTDSIVLVKNPVSPDLELWIGALERFARVGLRKLGAIHRGFASGDRHDLRNPPEWSIPLQFRQRMPDVPLICDPSHIAGRRELIPQLSQRALDLGLDGLMVEVHPDPSAAWTDSAQQLNTADYVSLMESLTWRPADCSEETITPVAWKKLETLRSAIDRLDQEFLELLASRMDVVKQIGEYKQAHSLDVLQPERWASLMDRRLAIGGRLAMSRSFISEIFEVLHTESLRVQSDMTSWHNRPNAQVRRLA